MIVDTNISAGYLPLIEIFAQANNLILEFSSRSGQDCRDLLTILYNDDSDTAMTITYMSYKHLGFENMLVDYLIKCGIDPMMISIGRIMAERNLEQLEQEWQAHRRKIFPHR